MPSPPTLTALSESARRREHRLRLIAALIAICRRIARLDVSSEAREASREVERSLQALARQDSTRKRAGGRR